MNHQYNIAIAQKLLEGIGSDRSPTEIANLFDAEVVFEIQGDDGVLPWIGRKTGRRAIVNFIRDIRTLTEPITFEVDDILASNSRVAIVGALQTRIKSTGKIIGTQFAIILTITGGVVTRLCDAHGQPQSFAHVAHPLDCSGTRERRHRAPGGLKRQFGAWRRTFTVKGRHQLKGRVQRLPNIVSHGTLDRVALGRSATGEPR